MIIVIYQPVLWLMEIARSANVLLGSQSVMVNGTSIISGCIIGAGSVVRKDILEKGIYSGNPATLKIKI